MKDYTVNNILRYKAKAIKTSPEYSRYVDDVLKDLEISEAKEAFMIGAIDAMINGTTYSMNDRDVFKRALLKEITKK